MTDEIRTFYFVCDKCAAVEPFPEHADYTRCGNCGSRFGETCEELGDAEELSEARLLAGELAHEAELEARHEGYARGLTGLRLDAPRRKR